MIRLFNLFIACLLLSGTAVAFPAVPVTAYESALSDDVFEGIEARITEAMNTSFMKRDISYLEAIRAEIAGVEGAENLRAAVYWTAYTDFNLAIFKLKSGKAQEATAVVGAAIETLDVLTKKDAEELTLLAFLQDFYVQFLPEDQREKLSLSATNNIAAALALEEDNMRANYVNGRIGFYDAGNETVEASLVRAIELPANKTGNTALPGWGKAEAYELLVNFYLKNKRFGEAGTTLEAALELYPDNYQLSVLVPKVKAGGE